MKARLRANVLFNVSLKCDCVLQRCTRMKVNPFCWEPRMRKFLSWDKVAGQCLPRSRSGRWRRGLASELRRAAFFGLYTLKDAVALYLLLSSSTVMRHVLQWQLNVFCSHNRTLILRRRIHLFKKDKDCAHWWMDFHITWMEDGPWTVINPIKFWSGSRMVFDTFQHGKLGY